MLGITLPVCLLGAQCGNESGDVSVNTCAPALSNHQSPAAIGPAVARDVVKVSPHHWSCLGSGVRPSGAADSDRPSSDLALHLQVRST